MWEKLTPDDIARARNSWMLTRADTLGRHAQELRDLDDEQDKIEELERLIGAFAEKYASSATTAGQPTTPSNEQPTEAVALEEHAAGTAASETQQDASSPGLRVSHQVPSFGIPLRRTAGR